MSEHIDAKKPIRILSLDGGGVRGIISARLLHRLEKLHEVKFADCVDLFCGTSTGAILAAGLAFGKSAEECVEFYQKFCPEIFSSDSIREISDLGNFIGSKYGNEKLKTALEIGFGVDTKLGDARKALAITSFDYVNWAPMVFTSWGEDSRDLTLSDVLMRSSAAPTFFPVHGGYIDGGVFANNPSLIGVIKAAARFDRKFEDLRLLSLGTGQNNHLDQRVAMAENAEASWGEVQWIGKGDIISVLTESVSMIDHAHCLEILRDKYCRINPMLSANPIDLDNWKKLDALMKIADDYELEDVIIWLGNVYLTSEISSILESSDEYEDFVMVQEDMAVNTPKRESISHCSIL